MAGPLTADDLLNHYPRFKQQISEIDPAQWAAFPDEQKLRVATQSALNDRPQSAQWFLATMTKNLAQQYDAVRKERWARRYLKLKSPDTTAIGFRLTEKSIGPPVQTDTQIVASYFQKEISRPVYHLLKEDFGLPPNEVVDIIVKHRSYEGALESQLSLMSQNRRLAWYNASYSLIRKLPGVNISAIENMARYTQSGPLTADKLLKRFPSFQQPLIGLDKAHWTVLPDYQKLRVAAMMAQNSNPQSAEWYLATMSKALAQQYDSFSRERGARPYLFLNDVNPAKVSFQSPEKVRGPPIVKDTKVIAVYHKGGVPRPAYLVLKQDFRLTTDDAVNLLIKNRSFEGALESQLSKMPSSERQNWYDRQFKNLSKIYGSQVNDERIARQLIAELSNSNESKRMNAASRLSRMGKRLSKSQIKEIEGIMTSGKQSWSKFLYRQSHCSWHERTSIKYYAAVALEQNQSPYVTSQMKNTARSVKYKSKSEYKVTDPGWV